MTQLPPRIIAWPVLRLMVPYTRQYILRLEKKGEFPRRILVGQNLVGWLASEIEAWINVRAAARNP